MSEVAEFIEMYERANLGDTEAAYTDALVDILHHGVCNNVDMVAVLRCVEVHIQDLLTQKLNQEVADAPKHS